MPGNVGRKVNTLWKEYLEMGGGGEEGKKRGLS